MSYKMFYYSAWEITSKNISPIIHKTYFSFIKKDIDQMSGITLLMDVLRLLNYTCCGIKIIDTY